MTPSGAVILFLHAVFSFMQSCAALSYPKSASAGAPLWSGACGLFGWRRPACVGQCVLQRYGMVAAAC